MSLGIETYFNGRRRSLHAETRVKQKRAIGYFKAIFAGNKPTGFIFDEALSLLQAAGIGNKNPEAQYWLGQVYMIGLGVSKSFKWGSRHLYEAGNAGIIDAYHELGSYYFGQHDYKQARHWWSVAANKKHGGALKDMGLCYRDGIGCSRSLEVAFSYFRRAAEVGHVPAYYYLSRALALGKGCEQNGEEARMWLEKGAAAGDVRSLEKLAALAAKAEKRVELVEISPVMQVELSPCQTLADTAAPRCPTTSPKVCRIGKKVFDPLQI